MTYFLSLPPRPELKFAIHRKKIKYLYILRSVVCFLHLGTMIKEAEGDAEQVYVLANSSNRKNTDR